MRQNSISMEHLSRCMAVDPRTVVSNIQSELDRVRREAERSEDLYKEVRDTLEAQIRSLQSSISVLERDTRDLDAENVTLNATNEMLSHEKGRLQSRVEDLLENVRRLTKESRLLEQMLSIGERKHDARKGVLNQHQETERTMEKRIISLKRKIAVQNEELKKMNKKRKSNTSPERRKTAHPKSSKKKEKSDREASSKRAQRSDGCKPRKHNEPDIAKLLRHNKPVAELPVAGCSYSSKTGRTTKVPVRKPIAERSEAGSSYSSNSGKKTDPFSRPVAIDSLKRAWVARREARNVRDGVSGREVTRSRAPAAAAGSSKSTTDAKKDSPVSDNKPVSSKRQSVDSAEDDLLYEPAVSGEELFLHSGDSGEEKEGDLWSDEVIRMNFSKKFH